MAGMVRLAAIAFCDPKGMVCVPADEVVNLPQAFWERLCLLPARVIQKTKSGEPEGANLRPLFAIRFLRHLKRTPH